MSKDPAGDPGKKAEAPSGQPKEPEILPELRDLVSRAKAGDASVLPRIRAILDENPEIEEYAGNLEKILTSAWTNLLAGKDPLAGEAIKRNAEKLRAELQGETPTVPEKLMTGLVVTTWLEVQHANLLLADSGSETIRQATYALKRSEIATKKHLAALRTLATVRALLPKGLVPASHLNVFDPKKRKRA